METNNKEKLNEDSFFSETSIANIPQNKNKRYSGSELNRVKVFKHLEKTQPTSIYQISKDLGMAYNTILYIIRDLVFAGVVHEQITIRENKCVKMLTIPQEAAE